MKEHMPILSTVEKAVQDGIKDAGRAMLKRARELSPDLTGESDKSGFTANDGLAQQVGFRSFVSRLQHENLEYQHPNGGQPKFLETASTEINVEQYVAARMRQVLGG